MAEASRDGNETGDGDVTTSTGAGLPHQGNAPDYVGCCGAYCRTCRPYIDGHCKGCKLGYEGGGRDLSKARCLMKVCCLTRGLQTCADCPEFASCGALTQFYSKNGRKYRKYREAVAFIRASGYDAFLSQADKWRNAYGRLETIKR